MVLAKANSPIIFADELSVSLKYKYNDENLS